MPELTYENIIAPNCEEINVIPCHVAYWIWRSVPLFLLVFGTCGNIMSLVVLSRKALRKYSTSVYLLFLAGSDLTNLLTSLLADAATALGLFNIFHMNDFSCKLVEWLLYTSGLFSVWVLVAITVERVLVIRFPLTLKQKLTSKGALMVSLVLLIAACLCNSHLLAGNQIVELVINTTNDTNNRSILHTARFCTQMPESHRAFYNSYWSLILLVVGGIIPAVVIMAGNAGIAVTVIRVRRIIRPNVQQRLVAQNLYKTPTKLLLALSAMFLCTTLPFTLYLMFLDYGREVDEHTLAVYQLLTVLAYCSVWCNYSFNFLLYFMNGHLFKKEWTSMMKNFSRRTRRALRGNTDSNNSGNKRPGSVFVVQPKTLQSAA